MMLEFPGARIQLSCFMSYYSLNGLFPDRPRINPCSDIQILVSVFLKVVHECGIPCVEFQSEDK